jgi:hypothetical protein
VSAPLIPVLVEHLPTEADPTTRSIECWFYAVPRMGEHVDVFDGPRRVSEDWPDGEPLFNGNVRGVMWSNRDPRPTVRIK